MSGTYVVTKWYYPTATSSGVPCEWKVWLDGGAAGAGWVTVTLCGAAASPVPAAAR